ncbi:hypothetical protein ACFPOI_29930 [Nonomuraea angiospora]|uniref:Uncharacterized protein n=1 Tax=Nonomuraea angiospora TaxID=46172 RepID=A0ABR9LVJ9_9ACTN|nr:hypothetical protein [Nonomuraea angiospora]MBE1584293.1 hypothetical protein [Nonomuraea angiospora]
MGLIADTPLEVDDEGLAVERDADAAGRIIGDRDIRLLLRENRIALSRGETSRVSDTVCDVPLTCVVHSHPQCRFVWSRLMVDLTPTPDAVIKDMAPREVMADQPVELKTTVGVGLKFEIAAKALSAEAKPEYSSSQTVYYPRIVSSGTGFTRGYWDFLALGERYLHADRELRLLVSAPEGRPVRARFQLRARVRFGGLAGLIPLLARGGAIDEVHRLDE